EAFDPAGEFAQLVEPPQDFAGTARLFGDLYGLEDEAERLIDDRARLLQAVRDEAAANPRSFTIANAGGDASAWVFNPGDDFLPGLLAEAGVTLNGRGDAAEFQVNLAEENLLELDDECIVFVEAFGRETYDELASSPVFQSIPAVQEGRVKLITDDEAKALLWPGPLAMPTVADVLLSLYD
ncbi:MAG: ABC transporter substrate-binding protein, partial [Actinomycetota bacterium]